MCNCVEMINKELENRQVRIAYRIGLNKDEQLESYEPLIQTEWIDKKPRGKSLPAVFVSYCPFCGEKKEDKKKGDA